jgi:hypothetical protein
VTDTSLARRYGRAMDEARAVLERLDRIEALDRASARPGELLAELRALVAEAEQWARRERDDRALEAADGCRGALERAGGVNPAFTVQC